MQVTVAPPPAPRTRRAAGVAGRSVPPVLTTKVTFCGALAVRHRRCQQRVVAVANSGRVAAERQARLEHDVGRRAGDVVGVVREDVELGVLRIRRDGGNDGGRSHVGGDRDGPRLCKARSKRASGADLTGPAHGAARWQAAEGAAAGDERERRTGGLRERSRVGDSPGGREPAPSRRRRRQRRGHVGRRDDGGARRRGVEPHHHSSDESDANGDTTETMQEPHLAFPCLAPSYRLSIHEMRLRFHANGRDICHTQGVTPGQQRSR